MSYEVEPERERWRIQCSRRLWDERTGTRTKIATPWAPDGAKKLFANSPFLLTWAVNWSPLWQWYTELCSCHHVRCHISLPSGHGGHSQITSTLAWKTMIYTAVHLMLYWPMGDQRWALSSNQRSALFFVMSLDTPSLNLWDTETLDWWQGNKFQHFHKQ